MEGEVKNWTKSSACLLPMLGRPFTSYKNLINVYYGDVEYPSLTDCLFLLVKFNGTIEHQNYEEELRNVPGYMTEYPVIKEKALAHESKSEYTMFVFEVSAENLMDYYTFKDGKYSHLSENLKQKIISYSGTSNKKILYPSMEDRKKEVGDKYNVPFKIWKDAELKAVPNDEKEIFNAKTML